MVGTPRLWVRDPLGSSQCPGCHYPIIQRLFCEVVDEMGIAGDIVASAGAGCACVFFLAMELDSNISAHGRPPDVATAMKRLLPQHIVLTVQGDGDAMAIGTEPLIHAAARAERITVLMLNNCGYAMTGGQMAPTTLLGQHTTTTPGGRKAELHGFPIQTAELLATIRGVVYSARGSVHTPANYQLTKKYVRTAIQKQIDDAGFSFVEIISACPPNWHLSPLESLGFIEEKVIPQFPLGEFKNVDKAG